MSYFRAFKSVFLTKLVSPVVQSTSQDHQLYTAVIGTDALSLNWQVLNLVSQQICYVAKLKPHQSHPLHGML